MIQHLRKTNLKRNDVLLWHYTSPDVFWKLLTGEFYATHYRFLNDSFEVEYGLGLYEAVLREFHEKMPYAINLLKEIRSFEFFLFCFSQEEDSLSQWRAYTPASGGISLGFSYNELAKRLNSYEVRTNSGEDFYEFSLNSCKYYTQELVEKSVRRMLRIIERERFVNRNNCIYKSLAFNRENIDNKISYRFDGTFSENPLKINLSESDKVKLEDPQYQKDMWHAYRLHDMLIRRCAIFKNPTFKSEKEYRLSIRGSNLRNKLELVGGKPRLKIVLPDLQKIVKKVYVSPHGDVDRNILLAEIARERMNLDFEICKSKSSFNGK